MRLPEIDMKSVRHPYPETTMFGAVELSAKKFPDAPAYDFMDKITSYSEFIGHIEAAARAFVAQGIGPDDAVTICMPNTPQAIICLYALNRIGAVANMVHPLSSQKNITFYLDFSRSKMILTLDQFYTKVKKARDESQSGATVIVARIQEELPSVKGFLYKHFRNRENLKYPDDSKDVAWSDFLRTGRDIELSPVKYIKDKTAVILYSGGTSGAPKGIQLTDYSFNALGMQIAEICGCNLTYGCKFLSVMPIFHGFGLGIGIHTILENGAMCILIPQFTKESYAEVVIKKKPNFIAGVPTLFEALLRVDAFRNADLSFLIGVFSGGDALNPELRKKADAFFREHNASVQIREGYGLTECVTASCVTPVDKAKDGSIGLPLRDMAYRIVEPGTFNELPVGEKGEIIISGPTLMTGYMDNAEETEKTLRADSDGTVWLFTGDLGSIDKEGFVYFHQRIKRMIITSGYNVYPSHVEKILDRHPDIDCSCVIGMPDPYKMQKIRAYISLADGAEETEVQKKKLLDYCSEYLDAYEMPQEIIFRKELPKTLVGKVAYHTLEEEARAEADVLFEAVRELLGIDAVDLSDSFVSLGGNSLKAMELKSALEEKGYDIQLSRIFECSDMQSLRDALTGSVRNEGAAVYSSVMNATNAQHRIYTSQLLAPRSTMYNITFAFRAGNVDKKRLETAVNAMLDRHESLRTHFENRNGQLMQIIDESARISVEKLTADGIDAFVRPFDLTASPLIRVGCDKNTVVVDMHHIISDGGSLPVFFRELNELYMGRKLSDKAVQYGEFAAKEVNYEQSEKYWLSVFADGVPESDLPTDFARPQQQSFSGNVYYDIADTSLHNRITEKCRDIGITPYVFYMAGFNILLAKLSGSEDIVTGMPVSGRNSRFFSTIGMFVNTVALRNKPEGAKSVKEFLDEVRLNSLSAIDNQYYPYEELVKRLDIEVGKRNPLFDVMLAYQSDEMTAVVFGDESAELLPVPASSSKCDFSFSIMPCADKVVTMIEYCTDLYREASIKRFADAYRAVLEQCLDESRLISSILITSAEDKAFSACVNDTAYVLPVSSAATLYSLFEENAECNPSDICIKTAERTLTYKDIKQFAEQTDSRLRAITKGRKSVIAVIAERSAEMYAGIYGIIRGGNAYLPISPDYPAERIEYILRNSSAAAVVAQSRFVGMAGSVPCIDMTELLNGTDHPCGNIPPCAEADDTAYVIYTSGSTGNPKGAMVSHRSAINRILWMHEKYPLQENDVILQKTPYTFDVSVWEIFWWGIRKGCLAASKPDEHFVPAKILDEVNNSNVTHLHFVPSVFDMFLKYLEVHKEERYKFSSVRYVFLSGEALSASLVNRFYALYSAENVTLHNLYGPTECAVDVSFYDCGENEADPVPIGRPVFNTHLYIVDRCMNIQPVGVRGELCIGGANVGKGYLANDELTAEKFVKNPFGDGRLYKTGDLAYLRSDGNIIFCGRMDNQIKLNGQRIEAGEIEAVIAEIPQVEAVAVVVQDKNGTDILAAFYCAKSDCDDVIHSACMQKLPSYMVPAAFCRLDAMPLNASGKLDRKQLSAGNSIVFDAGTVLPPVNETEKFICDAFSRALGVEGIGRNSNFFALGGTSLSVISLLAEKGFEEFSAADLVGNPTPALLAAVLAEQSEPAYRYVHMLYDSADSRKLFVMLPFAGGSAENFAALTEEFRVADLASVAFVDYLHSDDECRAAAEEIRSAAKNKDVYFYSHCVGSAVACKIIDVLEGEFSLEPARFIAGASLPMSRAIRKNPWRICPDKILVGILSSAGAPLYGISEEKRKALTRDFRRDTDFAVSVFSRSSIELQCPIDVIINKNDMFTKNHKNAEKLWQRYTSGAVRLHYIGSDTHYFQSDNAKTLFELLLNISGQD